MSRKKIIALLLTIFALPGAGQLTLGRKKLGWFLMACTLLILAVATYLMIGSLKHEMTQWSDPQLVLTHSHDIAAHALASTEETLRGVMWLLVALWIYAIGDVLLYKE